MSFQRKKRFSTIESLKEIVVFLAALTFANAISNFLFDESSRQLRQIAHLTVEQWFCFVFLIVGVVRFYHGNWRLLDDSYTNSGYEHGVEEGNRKNIIWLDFVCVLSVSLGFAALSFYINYFSAFVVVYAGIIVIDIIWLHLTRPRSTLPSYGMWSVSQGSIQIRIQGTTWFWNNVGLFVVFVFLFLICLLWLALFDRSGLDIFLESIREFRLENSNWLFSLIVVLFCANAIIDIYTNRVLYFPPRQLRSFDLRDAKAAVVFLAAPLTQLLNSKNGDQSIGSFSSVLAEIIDVFESRSLTVFNAHRRESWGRSLEAPDVALKKDLDEILRSDVVVAIIGSPPSPGVQLEIGYSLALNKPILLLVKNGEFVPYLNRRMGLAGTALTIVYERDEDIPQMLVQALFK
ncbi:MAG: nucleoside 2-deoxyribosyltransferase [Pseudorhodoplanes sp.]|nr:nucleoside 2-deoxyribosyltransferase [Pseudorhodoplanes sp.]